MSTSGATAVSINNLVKKRLSTLLKIAVTLLGLWLAFQELDLQALGQTLLQAHLGWLLSGLLLVSASMVLRAFRWSLLLQGLGIHVPFARLVELYFIGSFFNSFLPSGFGGDVVRVLEITREIDLDVATGTVILDRLSGLIMLFVMALLLLPWRAAAIPIWLHWLIVGGTAVSLLIIALLLEHRLICRLGKWLPGPLSPVGSGLLAKVLKAVQACGLRAIISAFGVSILFNLMLASWWATTGRALDLQVPFSYYIFAVPILSIALMAPSVGGLGVRELLAPTLFAAANVPNEQAVSLSLLVFALERLSGLFGAPLYLLAHWRHQRQPTETAESQT
ncbi:MAG: flippase-like domain-containing protein [Anaerolineales bacterium]|nr:flippase-like domain-containing protein [Anaerolineales bacterium]MCB8967881.1 flippase-like domain-containing protein [Ardenticatenaceae bacterium]